MSDSLPDIPIPRSPRYGVNQDRYGDNMERCLLCARPINLDAAHVVLLTSDLGRITAPVDDQEHTGGCFYVGPDCWRSHKELHLYEVK